MIVDARGAARPRRLDAALPPAHDPALARARAAAQRSAASRLPPAGWVLQAFAVLVLLLASGALFAISGSVEESGSRPEILLAWVVVYLIAGVLLLDGRLRLRRRVPLPTVMVLYVALTGLSVLWSAAPSLTLRRSVGLTGTVLVGLLLAQRLRPIEVLHAVRRTMVIIAVASLLLYLSGSGLALDEVHGTLRGVLATKNTLGRNMALGILAAASIVILDPGSVRRCALSMVPMAAALALTDSTAGALLAVLALLGVAVTVVSGKPAGKVLLGAAAAVLVGFLSVTVPTTSPEQIAGIVGEDTSLTGRDAIWAQAVDASQTAPLVGRGYGAFWTGTDDADRIRAVLQWDVPHAHNGLLDVVLELGLVGAVVALALLVHLLWTAVHDARRGMRDAAVLRLSVAGLLIVSNVVESGFMQQNSLLTVLLVVAVATRSASLTAGPAPPAPQVVA